MVTRPIYTVNLFPRPNVPVEPVPTEDEVAIDMLVRVVALGILLTIILIVLVWY